MKESWVKFYSEQAKEAAKTECGAHLLIGILTEIILTEKLTDFEKIEHAKFLLAEYHKERGMERKKNEMGI